MTEHSHTDPITSCCGGALRGLSTVDATHLASELAALADPVRLQVLSMIGNAAGGEVCACDFVGPIGKSQPTISHHLKVLTEAGLIEGDRRGRWIWYRVVPGRLESLVSTLNSATSAAVS
jgi:ArsR family transcriptional regulator, arsenate/arsenite/antimonite-responsive transcriptional repressor